MLLCALVILKLCILLLTVIYLLLKTQLYKHTTINNLCIGIVNINVNVNVENAKASLRQEFFCRWTVPLEVPACHIM